MGIALLQSNGRKGRSPFNGRRPCRPPLPRIQNHCAKSGKLVFFKTNSGSINEPLMGGRFFCGERGRIKALAEPIFVRGVSTFYDRRTLRPPELEGLRNLPQKFHFPYWGRKGKNKSRYPPKRAGAPPRRAFAPPRGRAFYGRFVHILG